MTDMRHVRCVRQNGCLFYIAAKGYGSATKYLWKDGTVHNQVCPHYSQPPLSNWPGYFSSETEAEICLRKYIAQLSPEDVADFITEMLE